MNYVLNKADWYLNLCFDVESLYCINKETYCKKNIEYENQSWDKFRWFKWNWGFWGKFCFLSYKKLYIPAKHIIIFDSFICLFVYLFLFIYIFKLILNHHCNIDFASTTRFIKGISNSILGCAVVVNQLTKASSFYIRVY